SASTALGRWGQPLEADWPYDPKWADGIAYSPPKRPGGTGWFRTGLRKISVALAHVRRVLDGGDPVLLGLTVFDTFYRPDADGPIADPPSGSSARGRHAFALPRAGGGRTRRHPLASRQHGEQVRSRSRRHRNPKPHQDTGSLAPGWI